MRLPLRKEKNPVSLLSSGSCVTQKEGKKMRVRGRRHEVPTPYLSTAHQALYVGLELQEVSVRRIFSSLWRQSLSALSNHHQRGDKSAKDNKDVRYVSFQT